MRFFPTLPFAALAIAATPVVAQDGATPPADSAAPAPREMASPPADAATPATPATPSDGTGPATPATPATPASAKLTAEQQAAYGSWPAETKAYFDGLPPGRQQLFLRITDNDKAKLAALPASQQDAVWASLEKQAAGPKTN